VVCPDPQTGLSQNIAFRANLEIAYRQATFNPSHVRRYPIEEVESRQRHDTTAGGGVKKRSTDMDELSRPSKGKLVMDALELIKNLKTILLLRGKRESDHMRRLFEMERELERAVAMTPKQINCWRNFLFLTKRYWMGWRS